MTMVWRTVLSPLFFFLLMLHLHPASGDGQIPVTAGTDICVYNIYIRVGTNPANGTRPAATLQLDDAYGQSMQVQDLVSWGGTKGPKYDYFAPLNLAIFGGRGECLDLFVCRMRLQMSSIWKITYVQTFIISPSDNACNTTTFTGLKTLVDRGSTTYSLDMCPKDIAVNSV